MKRFLLFSLLPIFSLTAKAQTNTWNGGESGDWSINGNWSLGHEPASIEDVVISANCNINMNSFIAGVRDITSLHITGGVTVRLSCSTNGTSSLRMSGTSADTKGLRIDAGNTLIFDATNTVGTGNWICDLTGGTGVTATIDGILRFEGTGTGAGAARLDLYTSASNNANLIVSGTGKIIHLANTGNTDAGTGAYLTMQSGSTFEQHNDGGSIPDGIFNPGSTVKVLSTEATPPVFNGTNYSNVEINCTGLTSPLAFNKNISFNDFNLISTGSNSVVVKKGAGAIPYTLTISGNLTVSSTSVLELSANVSSGDSSGSVKVKGHIVNNGKITAGNGENRFELSGSVGQNISGPGTWFGHRLFVVMNNPAGATLLSPVNLRCYLVLNNGKIRTSSTNILMMAMVAGDPTAGGWYGGSSVSFVEGPMRRVSNRVSFTFPIGKGNVFAPVAYRHTINYLLTDTFTAEYFRVDPGSVYGTNYDPAGNPEIIHHLSKVEYWSVLKNPGGLLWQHRIEPIVMLTSFCHNLDSTFVARYDAATNQWTNCNNYGRNLFTPGPPYVTGQIYGAFVSLGIGIFTLATNSAGNTLSDPAQSPLPIRLLAFNAIKLTSSKSLVNWQTADFSSADEMFEVQRAGSDRNFITIGMANGSETSHLYAYTDNDAKVGVNYYRLRMTDKDADVSYSKTVAITNTSNGLLITSLFPTVITSTATLTVTSRSQQPLGIMISDMLGRVFLRRNFKIETGNTDIELSFVRLGAGAYLLTATGAEGITQTIRFIKK